MKAQTAIQSASSQPTVIYPEHGTGRTAKLITCAHCGGKPLIVSRCSARKSCAVCSKCGYHPRLSKLR